jgi:hypothetical protein
MPKALTASQVLEAWREFKPEVPFSYLVAARKAARKP